MFSSKQIVLIGRSFKKTPFDVKERFMISSTVINKYLIRDRKNQVFGIKKDTEPKIMLYCTTHKKAKKNKEKLNLLVQSGSD